jgi:hypothetical protein
MDNSILTRLAPKSTSDTMYVHYTLSRDLSGNQDNIMSNLLSPLAEKEKKRGTGLQALAARESEAGGFSRRFVERNGGDGLDVKGEASLNAERGPFSLDPNESTHIGVDSGTNTEAPERRGGLDDLAASLPFNSAVRASTNVGRTQSSDARPLNLPQPPQPVVRPPEPNRLTTEHWQYYISSMKSYMAEWYKFQSTMIGHFRERQVRLQSDMNENWLSMRSDGPSAENVEAAGWKAGYSAYMQWQKEDEMARAWWDRACESHKEVMEYLGEVREKLKSMESVQED